MTVPLIGPARTADPPASPRRPIRLPRPFTAEELEKLETALRSRPELHAACSFLSETGLRISEALAVTSDAARSWPKPHRWCRRCRRHRAVLRVIGKGNRERLVPLTPRALRAAHALLPSSNGHLIPWPERTFRRMIADAGAEVGVHAWPHRYRHSFATSLVNAGAPIEVVADLMGHSNIQITRVYFLLSEERAFAAVGRRQKHRRTR